jgi:hypothetical protein
LITSPQVSISLTISLPSKNAWVAARITVWAGVTVSTKKVSGGFKAIATNNCEYQSASRQIFSPFEISSQATPILAALIFDFSIVDIRRVGTQSKRILVVGCSA